LLGYYQWGLGDGPDAAKAEFSEQGTLVDFLEEPGAKGVGDLKDRAEYALGQIRKVHAGKNLWPLMNADERGLKTKQLPS
jgi:hypothetical protein